MIETLLETLCDITTVAHTRIQQDFQDINPIVGVSKNMRKNGVPADAMTIDCLKSGKRIIIVLHDHNPDIINYQFSFKDKDPDSKFEQLPFKKVTSTQIYDWIKVYFS